MLLVLGEYIWEQEVIPPAEQWQTGVKQLPRARRLRGRPGRADRAGAGAVPAVAGQQRRYDGPLPRRRAIIPAVKANIDVSHLLLAKVQPEELRRLKGKAIHVHISDCDGKVHGDLPPGRGVVPFEPYLREIKALGIDGAISIELEYSPSRTRSRSGSRKRTRRRIG